MSKARYGSGRHRQAWVPVTCPHCARPCHGRRTLPGRPWHIRTHFDSDGELCPPLLLGEVRFAFVDEPPNEAQLSLFG